MRFILAALALALTASAASASGGIGCEASDKAVKLTIQSGVTRGMGSPLFQFQAQADVLDPKAPKHLQQTAYTDENVSQYWLDGESLKMVLYRETEGDLPHGYVMVTILTTTSDNPDDEGIYKGEYFISLYDVGTDASAEALQIEHSGTVSCFVE
ncbi:MAG: hypothetical protein KF723_16635 [Rhizobiaceae bacterium]|nr:hypothetical protein [Rhizobiaceae bacterium]